MRADVDGSIEPVAGDQLTPFAVVTWFDADADWALAADLEHGRLAPRSTARASPTAPARSAWTVVRGGPGAVGPSPAAPISPAGRGGRRPARLQLLRGRGDAGGFRFPAYSEGLEVAGYHLHFVTADRTRGGHVLGCRVRAGARVRLDASAEMHLELPPGVDSKAPSSGPRRRLRSTGSSERAELARPGALDAERALGRGPQAPFGAIGPGSCRTIRRCRRRACQRPLDAVGDLVQVVGDADVGEAADRLGRAVADPLAELDSRSALRRLGQLPDPGVHVGQPGAQLGLDREVAGGGGSRCRWRPWFSVAPAMQPWGTPNDRDRAAYADARPGPLLAGPRPTRPNPRTPLDGDAECDLVDRRRRVQRAVGGGPGQGGRPRPRRRGGRGRARRHRRLGRNGGFFSSSLTHGLANGLAHFPDEVSGARGSGSRTSRRCGHDPRRSGSTRRSSAPASRLRHRPLEGPGWPRTPSSTPVRRPVELFDATHARARSTRPPTTAADEQHGGRALVDPARLAWGLRRAALDLGVRLHEHSPVDALERDARAAMQVRTAHGGCGAREVLLATNAYRGLVRRHPGAGWCRCGTTCSMTEPLVARTASPRSGGRADRGSPTSANQFHYYRRTADDRILWGGYDAI